MNKKSKKSAVGWIILGIAGLFLPLVPGIACICYGLWLLTGGEDER